MDDDKRKIDYSQPAKSPEKALESLMHTCAKMERCIADVRRSLSRWRMSGEDYGPIIERLVREKFVDQERYARSYVREKMSQGSWGRKKIETGLKQKGIPADSINRAIEDILDPERQGEQLEKILSMRYEKEREKSAGYYQLRTRLIRWAVGRGYDYESIRQALQKITGQDYE